jgi:RNA polymerase-binding transcription factor DksA
MKVDKRIAISWEIWFCENCGKRIPNVRREMRRIEKFKEAKQTVIRKI